MTLTDVAAFFLEHARRYGELSLQSDARRCVLTAPACYGPAQRQALVAAGKAAGFEVERVLDDPLALATSWGFGRQPPPVVVVYDFGGGKFECSVVQMSREPKLLASHSDSMISGDELDHRILDYTVKAFWQVHHVDLRGDPLVPLKLRDAAEKAKIALSGQPDALIHLPQIITPPGGGKPLDLHLTMSREVAAAAIGDIVQRSFAVRAEALRQAGVAAAVIGEILLCGGVTRLPFVREAVGAYFGRQPRTDTHPDEGVALGAAIWGAYGGMPDAQSPTPIAKRVTANFGSDAQQAVPSEAVPAMPAPQRVGRVQTRRMFTAVMQAVQAKVAEHEAAAASGAKPPTRATPMPFDPGAVSFGAARPVKPVMPEVLASRLACSTVGGFCDEIIGKDIAVPTEKTRVFSTGKDGQQMVRVEVCQGDSRRFEENQRLGIIVLDGLPARPRGAVRIAVCFNVDADGVLKASARDEATGMAQSVEIRLWD
jgi:molecular chaperone DnaK (HSP70)